MPKQELRIGDTPEDGSDRIVKTWLFRCTSCGHNRKAVMFGSGHVLDLAEDQEVVAEAVENVDGLFKNLYLIPEIADGEILNSPDGIAHIKQAIGFLHARQFHGANVKVIGKN